MKRIQTFDPYNRDTTIIVSKDEQGLRIDGELINIRTANGIISIENNSAGIGHSCHPNIDSSGSVAGMKKLGFWGKKDKTVHAHGFIYNTSKVVISHPLDLLAYLMQEHGYKIKDEVIKNANNPLWGGIAVTLPKISK